MQGCGLQKILLETFPSALLDNQEFGAREMTIDEVRQLRDAFVAGAVRAKTAGYDGIEVHGAHGYIVHQFLSSEINQRTDEYGGSYDKQVQASDRDHRGYKTNVRK